jgi:signal transduction histidine kinase
LASGPNIWRTSTFRLVLLYAILFSASIGALFCFVEFQINAYVNRQVDDSLNWERRYFVAFTPADLRSHLTSRVARDRHSHNYYGLFAADRSVIAGDILSPPPRFPVDGLPHSSSITLASGHDSAHARVVAIRVASDETLVLAYDTGELVAVTDALLRSLVWGSLALLVAGVVGGIVWSVRPIRRILEIQRITRLVVRGDLKQRLPVTGRNDELDMMSGIINHMLGDIERLINEVKSVCDAIAHDLRTPLARLHTLLNTLESSCEESDPKRRVVTQAIGQTDMLLARFGALLRVSEIEQLQRRSGFSDISLNDLLSDVYELYVPLAEAKCLRFMLDVRQNANVHADRALMFEALSNLVDNAIKFAPQDGVVTLAVRTTRHDVSIEVADNGPGIPHEEHEAVLKRFYRGKRNSTGQEGHGLGLSIVAAVARLHEFRIEISNAEDGTRISIHCGEPFVAERSSATVSYEAAA